MPRVDFSSLPDHGRLWVFPASRSLSDADSVALLDEVDAFLEGWAAHGAPLRSGRELHHRRFLLVGADSDAEAPSGCSIDALVRRLDALGASLDLTLLDHAPVWYRGPDGIRSVPRPEFKALAGRGEVNPTTRVFDTTLSRISELRAVGLERDAADGWHARAFFAATARGS